jgi:hypothetical protein
LENVLNKREKSTGFKRLSLRHILKNPDLPGTFAWISCCILT